MKFSLKLTVIFLFIGIITVIALGTISFNASKKSLIIKSYDQLASVKDIKKKQIEFFFEERLGDLQALASNPSTAKALIDMNNKTKEAKEYGFFGENLVNYIPYKEIHDRYDKVFSQYINICRYDDLFIINNDGDIIYSVAKKSDFGTNLSIERTHLESLWKNVEKTGKTTLSDMKKYAPSKDAPAMFVACPIYSKGIKQGTLAFQISNDAINKIMQQSAGLGKSGETYLVGSDYLLRNDSRFEAKTVLMRTIKTESAKLALSGNNDNKVIIDVMGNPVLSSFAKLNLQDIDWIIIAEIDIAEVMQPINKMAKIIFIISMALLVIIIVVTYYINREVKLQLGGEPNEIAEIAEKIASGNLSNNFDQNRKLRGVYHSMKNMNEKLTEIVTSVNAGSQSIAIASQQMNSISQQISQSASEQAASAEEVSSSIEEMAANIQQNSEHALITEKIVINAAEGINISNNSTEVSVKAMNEIADKITLINDIAFQTNILALNAAVEAARAGEYGKGFTVVAAEVRKLAERSKVAADEIDQLSKKGVDVSIKAGQHLVEIIPEIKKTEELVKEIAAASIEQRSGADQVNNAIQQLNQITQRNASASEELATSSEELSSQADQLREIISFFTINSTNNKKLTKTNKVNNYILNSVREELASKPIVEEKLNGNAKNGVDLELYNESIKDYNYEKF